MTSSDHAARGRPIDHAKREAILSATRQLINSHGLQFTIDDVAEIGRVARQTIYNAFGGKDQLIAAVVQDSMAALIRPLEDAPLSGDVADILSDFGRRYVSMIFQPQSIALVRAMIAQGERSHQSVDIYFQKGPAQAHLGLRRFLDQRVARGDLAIPDTAEAVEQFYGMLRGNAHFRLILGLVPVPDMASLHRRVDACVSMFLQVYKAQ